MNLRLILLFALSFLFGLVQFAPADKVIHRLLPPNLPLELSQISGSLLHGKIGQLRYGDFQESDVHWSLQLHQLLFLNLAADIAVSVNEDAMALDDHWAEFEIRFGILSSDLEIRKLRLETSLANAAKPFNIGFMPIDGQLSLDIAQARISDGLPQSADGNLKVLDAAWKIGQAAPLGDYEAQLHGENGQFELSANDAETGKVDVEATASLQPDMSYLLQGKIKPKAETPKPVVNSMKALGRTDRQGWYAFQSQGQLRP